MLSCRMHCVAHRRLLACTYKLLFAGSVLQGCTAGLMGGLCMPQQLQHWLRLQLDTTGTQAVAARPEANSAVGWCQAATLTTHSTAQIESDHERRCCRHQPGSFCYYYYYCCGRQQQARRYMQALARKCCCCCAACGHVSTRLCLYKIQTTTLHTSSKHKLQQIMCLRCVSKIEMVSRAGTGTAFQVGGQPRRRTHTCTCTAWHSTAHHKTCAPDQLTTSV